MTAEAKMSQPSTQELVKRLRPRYLKAEREEKGRILDEFVAVTGMHRKAAIRRMRTPPRKGGRERRGRPKKYTGSAVAALGCIWHVCGCICGKRLKPILDDMVDSLERHGELRLDPETRALLSTVSPATIMMRPHYSLSSLTSITLPMSVFTRANEKSITIPVFQSISASADGFGFGPELP